MEVIIRERSYNYTSDFPHGWKFSSGDEFKFPVVIGNNSCFLKRFKRNTSSINGWGLLQQLKRRNVPGLPRVYDIVHTQEQGKNVNYVFYEYLPGSTLDKCIEENEFIELDKLGSDIFNSLRALHTESHWFVDFCEKNIFYTGAKFLLIDLDSTQTLTGLPDNSMDGNKDFWILVFNYYRHVLKKPVSVKAINGITLNYLQLLFLVLKLKKLFGRSDGDINSEHLFNSLPQELDRISPQVREVFTKALEQGTEPLEPSVIAEIKELLPVIINAADEAGETIEPEEETVIEEPVEDEPVIIEENPEPIINVFEAVTNSRDGETYVVYGTDKFTLTWQVENTDRIEVFKNNNFFETPANEVTSIQTAEKLFDGKEKINRYTLKAFNGDKETEQTITVKITAKKIATIKKPPVTVPPETNNNEGKVITPDPQVKPQQNVPVIKAFSLNKHWIFGNSSFLLNWEVENAKEVYLYKNGSNVKKLINKGVLDVNDDRNDSIIRKTTYTIQALNDDKKIQSGPETTTEINLKPLTKVFVALVAVVVLVIAAVWFFGNRIKVDAFAQNAVTENDTILLTGKNFPTTRGSMQVRFNFLPGSILKQTTDSLLVQTPIIAKEDKPVNITVYAGPKLLYTATGVLLRKKVADNPVANNVAPVKDTTPAAPATGNPKFVLVNPPTKGTKKKPAQNAPIVQAPVVTTQVPEKKEDAPPPVAAVTVNMREFVKLDNSAKKGFLGLGGTRIKVSLHNTSKYTITSASVEVTYLKGTTVTDTKQVEFKDVAPNATATVDAPKISAKSVELKLVQVTTKEYGKQ